MQLKKIDKNQLQDGVKYLVFIGENFFTSYVTRNLFGDYFDDVADKNIHHVNEVSAIFEISKCEY